MPTFSTTIRTEHASKYLQQLCKHFAHKVAVRYSPEEGRVELPPGRCLMRADAGTLRLDCDAREDRGVPVIQDVLDAHLVKFAWREELTYAWTEGAPEASVGILADDDFLADPRGADGNDTPA